MALKSVFSFYVEEEEEKKKEPNGGCAERWQCGIAAVGRTSAWRFHA